MTKKGTWELDVHLFFMYFYFYFVGGIRLLLSQGRNFLFLWNKVPEVLEG